MEFLRWLCVLVLAGFLPGVGAVRLLRRWIDLSPAIALAAGAAAGPVLFGLAAVLLGAIPMDPWAPALALAAFGLATGARRSALAAWANDLRCVRWIMLVPLIVGGFTGLTRDPLDLRSDSYAHVAAVRATMEESAVFPDRGFHGDEASRGADPRFGTLHALYGVAAEAAGSDVFTAWDVARGVGAGVLVAGGLALLTVMATSPAGLVVGALALLATTGGTHYNALDVASYPLWFALGIVWTLAALVVGASRHRPHVTGVVAGLTLAGLVGMHFFAFMLGGFLLGCLLIARGRAERAADFRMLLIALAIAAPVVALRFLTSYANANPIHQRVWQCLQWSPGLYSASPIYVLEWLFPVGFAVLVWALLRIRSLRAHLRYRWWMVVTAITLLWTLVPWFLSPSMELIGFLPLRLYMAVGIPFLLAFLVEVQRRGRTAVALVVSLLLIPTLYGRAADMAADPGAAVVPSVEWKEAMRALESADTGRVVLASDPFTMMAAQAFAGVDVVAVPDGRSSPRDPEAIERLRDAWSIMSPAEDGAGTLAALGRRSVTHVLVNGLLPTGLSSYEYPVSPVPPAARLAKFVENPARFAPVWGAADLVLFRLQPDAVAPLDESYLRSCRAESARPGVDLLELGSGYRLAGARVDVSGPPDARVLHLDGELRYAGDGPAPDRHVVVRLDRVPPRIPEAWRFVGKPLRKIRERWTGEVDRYRWAVYPGNGLCPLWRAAAEGSLQLGVELELDPAMPEGTYRVCVAARQISIFEPLRPQDLFVDDDSYQGPEIGRIVIP